MEMRLWKKVSAEYFSIKVDLNDLLFVKICMFFLKGETLILNSKIAIWRPEKMRLLSRASNHFETSKRFQ